MKALIFAPGTAPEMEALTFRRPNVMLPLMDRPFLQHVVEYLVARDINHFEVVVSHMPEQIERLLRHGHRWGSSVKYHLARDADKCYRRLKAIWPVEGDEPVLIGHGDSLPPLGLVLQDLAGQTPVFFNHSTPEGSNWTGWAVLSAKDLAGLDLKSDFKALAASIKALDPAGTKIVEVDRPLEMNSYSGMLDAHRQILAKDFKGLLNAGLEADPGIWISRNVSLNPTARIIAPVFIGENCRIDAGVQLGPNAVIGADCSLDQSCSVSDSIILPGSYVGRGLELSGCLVDRSRLINIALGVDVSMADDFLLGSLTEGFGRKNIHRWISQAMALLLFLLSLPVMAATILVRLFVGPKPVFTRRKFIRLPTAWDAYQRHRTSFLGLSPEDSPLRMAKVGPLVYWRHLFLVLLPGLMDVVRGRLGLIGQPPRDSEEISQLPEDWRYVYLKGRAGLISEALLQFGGQPDEDELYSAEAYFAATASLRRDASLFLKYLGRLLGRR